MKHKFYPLALGLFIISSCGKDKTEILFALEGDYEAATTISAANPIAMYTKNGLVTNQVVVDLFLSRTRLIAPSSYSRTDVPIPTGNTLKLTIQATGKATLVATDPTSSTTTQVEVSNSTAQSFVLANLDSVSSLSAGTSQNRCAMLAEKIKSVYLAKRCVPLPPSSGGPTSLCKFRPIQVIKIRDGKLFLSLFSWLVQSNQSYSACGQSAGNERNSFNPAILNQLVDGDTIVVQEREIALIKK